MLKLGLPIPEGGFQPEKILEFDLESLNAVVDLAGDAGSATSKVSKAAETIKRLFKRAETATDAEIKLAMSELTMQIANAQMANSDLKLQLTALKEDLAKRQAFQTELDRYELWETPAGSIVYRLRETAGNNDPLHYLCPPCVEEKRKSILQGHSGFRQCPRCKTDFQFERVEARTRQLKGSIY